MGELLICLITITAVLAYFYNEYLKHKRNEINKRNLYISRDLIFSNKMNNNHFTSTLITNRSTHDHLYTNNNKYNLRTDNYNYKIQVKIELKT